MNWPRRYGSSRCPTASPASTPRSPSWPIRARACGRTAPARTTSSRPRASTPRSPASSRVRCCAPTWSARTTSTARSSTANSPAPTAANWGGSFLGVPTASKHQKEAVALAKWLTAPEQQAKVFAKQASFPSTPSAYST
ncbi:extracellular solute-binding protein, partial [Streptomyces sp. uw30]